MEEKILKYIGFAAAGRGTATGTALVLDAVRAGKAKIVLLASDASARTAKQVCDKCATYSVPVLPLAADMEALGRALGKRSAVAAAAVTDAGIADAILREKEKGSAAGPQ